MTDFINQADRHTTAQIGTITPPEGDVLMDVDKKVLVVGGGDVKGGTPMAKESNAFSYTEPTYYSPGDAWDDLVNSLIGAKLESAAGKVDYDYTENAVKFQSGGNIATAADRVVLSLQKPHAAKAGSMLKLHIHWEQVNTNKIEFTVQYRIQANNAAKTTAWTTVTSNSDDDSVFTYTTGTLNQITRLASIDWNSAGISATVQIRLARTDSTTGDILGTFVDGHVNRDSDGSGLEYTK